MSRALLDTHLLLWAAESHERLPLQIQTWLDNPGNQPVFSVVSLWEIVIKSSLQKPGFRVDARVLRSRLLQSGYQELEIKGEHALTVSTLPLLHKDPFDRILVAQAIAESTVLFTEDRILAPYSEWVQTV